MKLNSKIYNILKWGLMIFIPAFNALIGTLGNTYGWGTETLIITINAIATFLGIITGISNYNYNVSQDVATEE